ncbi:hypothetical protein NC651_035948 [Populus alba x Populus x berolinensis]|nr:hypothetical protein NC651_035948 [Populus alba x Populus x berolinensis]
MSCERRRGGVEIYEQRTSVEENGSIDQNLLIDPKLLFIGNKIGEGAHGEVYKGRYGDLIVAIKVLHPGTTSEERAALEDRFAREVNMMSRVKHENLVKFIGACKDPFMVIVTELLPGMSLRKYLVSIRPKQLDLYVAINFALDVARAMDCLHANGIIHRDLKPDNLLLTANHKSVKLADFGLAREETVTEMMTAETGTYRWMAPEIFIKSDMRRNYIEDLNLNFTTLQQRIIQILFSFPSVLLKALLQLYSTVTLRQGEKKHYNNKVDVYSFGIVLWELLTNRMPFEGMSNLQAAYAAAFKQERPALPEDVSPDLAFIMQSCWVEDPNLRPSFNQIIRMLNAFLFTLSPPSPTPSLPESDTNEAASSSNGNITEFSSRTRGKFAFLRQLFTAKKTRNTH